MSHRSRRLGFALGMIAIAGIAIWYSTRTGQNNDRIPLVFDGTSDQLRQTAIVPTLDMPIPEGKNAIWCASFQYAWNHLKDDLAGEPIRLENAQTVADRLNRSDQTEEDVEPASVYAAAGFAKDGIVERIQSEMAKRFPDSPRPELDVTPDGAIAYAFLTAACEFDTPFLENNKPFFFRTSAGEKTAVISFGTPHEKNPAREVSKQVSILYQSQDEETGTEFIFDLCETSRPYQIVLARVDRKQSLAATLNDIREKINSNGGSKSSLSSRDSLLVPNMDWSLTHRFTELEGSTKPLRNPKLESYFIGIASQTVRFRLNRRGAELTAEAKLSLAKSEPRNYYFDRPFLLYMKKRDAQQPFLVLWIENAELLQKK